MRDLQQGQGDNADQQRPGHPSLFRGKEGTRQARETGAGSPVSRHRCCARSKSRGWWRRVMGAALILPTAPRRQAKPAQARQPFQRRDRVADPLGVDCLAERGLDAGAFRGDLGAGNKAVLEDRRDLGLDANNVAVLQDRAAVLPCGDRYGTHDRADQQHLPPALPLTRLRSPIEAVEYRRLAIGSGESEHRDDRRASGADAPDDKLTDPPAQPRGPPRTRPAERRSAAPP